MRVSDMFAAFCVYVSDTARNGPTRAGMAGLRHKARHKKHIPPLAPQATSAELMRSAVIDLVLLPPFG